MILLRLISWPHARKHVLRTILTTSGIVLGVAVFVGMHTANQTVLWLFTDSRSDCRENPVAGDGRRGGVRRRGPRRRAVGATVRVAVPVIEVVVDSNIKGEGNLLVLGVDMTGDRSLRDYDLESSDDAASSTIRWCSWPSRIP